MFGAQKTLRIVDAPCGDMTWMPLLINDLALAFEHVEYIGIDIVPDLINRNKEEISFSENVDAQFKCLDVTREPIPDCDLLLCKDLVNHLSNRDVLRLLENIQSSYCKYAVITSNRGCVNTELPASGIGATRLLDLQEPPFSLPQPVQDDGYLAFWELPWRPFNSRSKP